MKKLLVVLLTFMITACGLSLNVTADIDPPTTLGAPEHFGVGSYYNDSVYFTLSVPEDIRTYIEKRAADDPDNKQGLLLHFQFDYKIDNGSWHHTSAWDSPKTVPDGIDDIYFTFNNGKRYNSSDRWSMTSIFQENEDLKPFYEGGWDYLKSHSITFRARFAESFDYGETFVISPWSKEFVLSANAKADYNKLINHAPALSSAEVEVSPSGEPYFKIKLDKVPGEVQDLNAMASSSVRTEIWMRRAGDKDFKYIHYEWVNWEYLEIEASDYFEGITQSYEAAGYEIKTRYALDLREYKQSGIDSTTDVNIYGPFSNVISHNMPAWSEASSWATGELTKANSTGLIPDILKGADLTKPITREEFCELALLLYEKSTGKSPAPVSPNPFTDTKNPQVLKAFALGITTGTSATTFSPQVLINREQCAAMLFRAIKAIHPNGDYSVAGIPDFPDQKDIAAYAVEAAKYMSKLAIVKGDAKGYFMPKATTTAQEAAGYGMATREAAILMSVRTHGQMDTIKATSGNNKPDTTVSKPAAGTSDSNKPADWIIGTWGYSTSNGSVNLEIFYEFKEDGTFCRITAPLVLYVRTGNVFEGKYRISGDKLILSDILKSTGPAKSNFDKIWYFEIESYDTKDIPVGDAEHQISRTAEGMLIIDGTEYTRGR